MTQCLMSLPRFSRDANQICSVNPEETPHSWTWCFGPNPAHAASCVSDGVTYICVISDSVNGSHELLQLATTKELMQKLHKVLSTDSCNACCIYPNWLRTAQQKSSGLLLCKLEVT